MTEEPKLLELTENNETTLRAWWSSGKLTIEIEFSAVGIEGDYATIDLDASQQDQLVNFIRARGVVWFAAASDPEREARDARLEELVAKATAWFESLTPEQQQAHLEEQKKSWVRGEMAMRESRAIVTVSETATELDRKLRVAARREAELIALLRDISLLHARPDIEKPLVRYADQERRREQAFLEETGRTPPTTSATTRDCTNYREAINEWFARKRISERIFATISASDETGAGPKAGS